MPSLKPLSLNMRGRDVRTLHQTLRAAGLDIPAAEVRAGHFGPGTKAAVEQLQRQRGGRPTGVFDAEAGRALGRTLAQKRLRRITGRVCDADGSPQAGLTIALLRRQLRAETALATDRSGPDGGYELSYSLETVSRGGRLPTQLYVRVSDQRATLAEVAVPPAGRANERLDLTVTRPDAPSEFEDLLEEVRAEAGAVDLTTLDEDDLAFLAREIGVDPLALSFLERAHTHAASIDDVPPEAFYGWFRQGLPTHLPALAAQEPSLLADALRSAVDARTVPAALGRRADALIAALHREVGRHLLREPDAPHARLLARSGASADAQAEFLRLQVTHEGTADSLWERIAASPSLGPHAAALADLCELSELAEDDPDAAEALAAAGIASPLALVRTPVAQVEAALGASAAIRNRLSSGGALPVSALGDEARRLRDAAHRRYAGAACLAALGNAPRVNVALVRALMEANPLISADDPLPASASWGDIAAADREAAVSAWEAQRRDRAVFPGVPGATLTSARTYRNPLRSDTMRLLENLGEIDLEADDVAARVAERGAAGLEGVGDPEGAVAQLLAMQRILRVTQHGGHAAVLLEDGLRSASDIARVEEETFVERYASAFGGVQAAQTCHRRAMSAAASLAQVAVSARQADVGVLPAVLRRPGTVAAQFPTMAGLFGAQSFCRCEQCLTVHSPAAYLADLLHFLNPTLPPANGVRPVTRLLDRRPDLAHIELTCVNTNTPLPYLDLVNEILEFRVAHDVLTAAAARNTGNIPAADLRVQPQHRIDAAYDNLARAVYPPQLPFDREQRATSLYLEHLGLTRHGLRAALLGDAEPNAPAAAADVLGLSPAEWAIVAGTEARPTREFYGYPAASVAHGGTTEGWIENLRRVPVFLSRSSISYDDLVQLVASRYWNGDRHLTIEEPGSTRTCDIEQYRISGLTARDLDRAHRLLRVRRHLGWSLEELDRALDALGAQDLDAAALVSLAGAVRLEREAGLERQAALTVVGRMPTLGATALYRSLFLRHSLDEALRRPLGLTADGSELADTSHPPSTLRPALTAALRLEAADWEAWAAQTSTTATLASISSLASHVFLARAAGLPLRGLLAWKARTATPTLAGASVETVLRFMRQLRALQAGPLDATELADIITSAVGEDDLAEWRRRFEAARNVEPGERGAAVRAEAAALFQLAPDVADALLTDALPGAVPGGLAAELADRPADFPWAARLTALHRAASIARSLALSAAEVRAIAANPAAFGGFSFTEILDTDVRPLLVLREYVHARGVLDAPDAWLQVMAAPDGGAAVAAAAALRVPEEHVVSLTGPAGWQWSTADWQSCESLGRVADGLKVARRAGVPPAALREVALGSAGSSSLLYAAIKAMNDHDTWLRVFQPIADRLREQQRDALVAYLLSTPAMRSAGITDTNALYRHLLIDVETSAVVATSRIKQAITSVQVFVEGCLLDAEPGVSAAAIDAGQWEWMRNYRVWEANRKVFLYPENWIEPDLRGDKTPFFKELEQELAQGELDDGRIEQAYGRYLDNLLLIANLEVRGFCREEAGGSEVLHLIGRTRQVPFQHFHRTLRDGVWTPWVRIDVDIEGDHILPVVHNRRLYVFWLRFEEKPETSQVLDPPYVESQEHFDWRTVEMPRWRHARAEYERQKQLHEVAKMLRGIFKSAGLDADAALAEMELDDNLEPPVEPMQPSEPAFSQPPALTRWEVRLCWTEYQFGRWCQKMSSSGTIASPMVHVEGAVEVGDAELDGETREEPFTTFVYLPRESEHWIDAVTSGGQLRVRLTRRYSAAGVVPGQWPAVVRDQERVGQFVFDCGQVHAEDAPAGDFTYESLWRPDGATNIFQSLQTRAGRLRLKGGEGWEPILGSLPGTEGLRVLFEHRDGAWVRQPSWFRHFATDDGERVYLARPVGGARRRAPAGLAIRLPVDSGAARRFRQPSRLRAAAAVPAGLVSNGGQMRPVASTAAIRLRPSRFRARLSALRSVGTLAQSVQAARPALAGLTSLQPRLHMTLLTHVHVCRFRDALERGGTDGLITLALQQLSNDPPGTTRFAERYQPGDVVAARHPSEDLDFGSGPHALYNWELFFHLPMLIASTLNRDRRFADAQRWYQRVFDPTSTRLDPRPRRYWRFRPFVENTTPELDQIQAVLGSLARGSEPSARVDALEQVAEWRDNPFDPHAIARLRVTAYQVNVVMRYIDNVLDWGDELFARDTLESIGQATLLYVLAAQLLGPRPALVAPLEEPPRRTFAELQAAGLDAFANAVVTLENALPSLSPIRRGLARPVGRVRRFQRLAVRIVPRTAYFCLPQNADLLAYWDRVADRLAKIRRGQNIEGLTRELELFEPPIDPTLLVRARAAGVSIAEVVAGLAQPEPCYRFPYLLDRASSLAADLRTLGGALLAAIEKRDAEALGMLRARHETDMLRRLKETRQLQRREAQASLEALEAAKRAAEVRRAHYAGLEKISRLEAGQMADLATAHGFQMNAAALQMQASAAHGVPSFDIGPNGWAGSPKATVMFGGSNVAAGIESFAAYLRMHADTNTYMASAKGMMAGFARRWEDWKLQETLAERELTQLDRQIVAAEVRMAMADAEWRHHEAQLANSEQVEEFLRTKFSGEELYGWMIAQTAGHYFQAYRLALSMARQAERALEFEQHARPISIVRADAWNGLRRGLLAGEQLSLDLKRLEQAYIRGNTREFEITRHVSLLALDPEALLRLKATGACDFHIPELVFDLDFPGHYLRRIRSVALSVPCVAGPYTSVSATLTLVRGETRTTASAVPAYAKQGDDDPRFVHDRVSCNAIATSSGQNDAGVFELNFRDERYLPFEGAGAISWWRLDLPTTFRHFDYHTISDVVVHLRYTARSAEPLKLLASAEAARRLAAVPGADGEEAPTSVQGTALRRLFSLRHDFPGEWHQFEHATPGEDQRLTFDAGSSRYPFLTHGRTVRVAAVRVLVRSAAGPYAARLELTGMTVDDLVLGDAGDGYHSAVVVPAAPFAVADGARWTISVRREAAADFRSLPAGELADVYVVVSVTVA